MQRTESPSVTQGQIRITVGLALSILLIYLRTSIAVIMTTWWVGPYFLRLGIKLQVTLGGVMMVIDPVISIRACWQAGGLLGNGPVMLTGLILFTQGASLFTFLPNNLGIIGYVLAIIILTPGYQLFQAANNTATLMDIPKRRQGTVSG